MLYCRPGLKAAAAGAISACSPPTARKLRQTCSPFRILRPALCVSAVQEWWVDIAEAVGHSTLGFEVETAPKNGGRWMTAGGSFTDLWNTAVAIQSACAPPTLPTRRRCSPIAVQPLQATALLASLRAVSELALLSPAKECLAQAIRWALMPDKDVFAESSVSQCSLSLLLSWCGC